MITFSYHGVIARPSGGLEGIAKMIVAIDGYELRCHHCEVTRKQAEFDIQVIYFWSNQYGCEIRLFI